MYHDLRIIMKLREKSNSAFTGETESIVNSVIINKFMYFILQAFTYTTHKLHERECFKVTNWKCMPQKWSCTIQQNEMQTETKQEKAQISDHTGEDPDHDWQLCIWCLMWFPSICGCCALLTLATESFLSTVSISIFISLHDFLNSLDSNIIFEDQVNNDPYFHDYFYFQAKISVPWAQP